jgi:hypothetical protein
MRTFRSPNSGQTSLSLQHATSPRSGYRPPAGHNADGYTMAERVGFRKGGSVSGKMKDLPDHLRHSLVNQAKSKAKKGFKRGGSAQQKVIKGKQERAAKEKDRHRRIQKFWKETKGHPIVAPRPNYKKGGWIQDVNKSIKKRGTKGKCTPITKKGCTGRAKALAKTFKKMAKKRKGK